jgi:polyhydroxyalkanoate synthesis regulator phasin
MTGTLGERELVLESAQHAKIIGARWEETSINNAAFQLVNDLYQKGSIEEEAGQKMYDSMVYQAASLHYGVNDARPALLIEMVMPDEQTQNATVLFAKNPPAGVIVLNPGSAHCMQTWDINDSNSKFELKAFES